MRPIDGDELYAKLKDAGMVFALRMVESAPTIDPPSNAPLTLEELREIVEQLEFCGYQCEGGPLEMHKAFILLKDLAYHNKPSE